MLRHLSTTTCLLHKVGTPSIRLVPKLNPAVKQKGSQTSKLQFTRVFSQGSDASGMLERTTTPVRDTIYEKMTSILKPTSLDVQDESSQHAGHAAMKGLPAGETHFRVSVVSQEFKGLTTIKRHKLVYQILAEELAGPIHALSLKTKTPAEEGS